MSIHNLHNECICSLLWLRSKNLFVRNMTVLQVIFLARLSRSCIKFCTYLTSLALQNEAFLVYRDIKYLVSLLQEKELLDNFLARF